MSNTTLQHNKVNIAALFFWALVLNIVLFFSKEVTGISIFKNVVLLAVAYCTGTKSLKTSTTLVLSFLLNSLVNSPYSNCIFIKAQNDSLIKNIPATGWFFTFK